MAFSLICMCEFIGMSQKRVLFTSCVLCPMIWNVLIHRVTKCSLHPEWHTTPLLTIAPCAGLILFHLISFVHLCRIFRCWSDIENHRWCFYFEFIVLQSRISNCCVDRATAFDRATALILVTIGKKHKLKVGRNAAERLQQVCRAFRTVIYRSLFY